MTRLAKPLLAVVVGISLLVLSAAPSGATVGTVTDGTATIDLANTLSIDLTGATAPCPNGGATLDVTTAGSGSPYSGTADLLILVSFTYQGSTWFLDLDASSASATITSAWWGGTLETGSFGPTGFAIYPEDATSPCTPDTSSPVCATTTLGASTPVLDLGGLFIGSVNPPGLTGTAFWMSGSGRISATGCTAPFTALSNKTLAISGVTVDF